MILGIDLSQIQGTVPDPHWQAIACDKKFAYLRAGVGNDSPDTHTVQYAAGARVAGVVVGPYHFAYPLPAAPGHAGRDPEDQAQSHFTAAGGLGCDPKDLPPACDLEWPEPGAWGTWGCSAAQIVDWTLLYLAKMQALTGRVPMLYSFPYFWKSLSGPDLSAFAAYPLWIASYQPRPLVPSPWTECAIQQTGGGTYRLPNGAPCDENCMTEAWWAQLVSP